MSNEAWIDEPRTLGTALVEINGLTHVAICGQDPCDHEWWAYVSCTTDRIDRDVRPGHVDRLTHTTCLWCVIEDNISRRASGPR